MDPEWPRSRCISFLERSSPPLRKFSFAIPKFVDDMWKLERSHHDMIQILQHMLSLSSLLQSAVMMVVIPVANIQSDSTRPINPMGFLVCLKFEPISKITLSLSQSIGGLRGMPDSQTSAVKFHLVSLASLYIFSK